jgi:hypothetical protein
MKRIVVFEALFFEIDGSKAPMNRPMNRNEDNVKGKDVELEEI